MILRLRWLLIKPWWAAKSLRRSQAIAAINVIIRAMKLFESILPGALGRGEEISVFAYLFVHRHIAERFPQYAIMDCPRAQSDAVGSLGVAEGCAAIKKWDEIAIRSEAALDALHQPATLLISETISLKDYCIVVIKGFGKMKIVFQAGYEGFEGF